MQTVFFAALCVLSLLNPSAGAPTGIADLGSIINGLIKAHILPIPQQIDSLKLHEARGPDVRAAMLGSIRTSWEQGTALGGIIEFDHPEYSVFAKNPFHFNGQQPTSALQLALSAVVRQAADGRLSQVINDGLDMAGLDGAAAGSGVLMGTFTNSQNTGRESFWQKGADGQLDYILYKVPKTRTGAFSHRADSRQYWADGVYMGPPYLAYYGAVTHNQSLIQLAYDNCRLYRDALLQPGPNGPIWAHIYDDDAQDFKDPGLWGTGNGWAALGMIRVAATIMRSDYAQSMQSQTHDLAMWVKEILDGVFPSTRSDGLIPDFIQGGPTFGDSASSAALASVAYRGAVLFPQIFGQNYTDMAAVIRDAVLDGVNDLGVISPVVDPLVWDSQGILSTEGQSFTLMMLAAWRQWLGL